MSENQRWREHFEIAREKLTHSRKGDRGLNNCGLSMTVKGRLSWRPWKNILKSWEKRQTKIQVAIPNENVFQAWRQNKSFS